MRRPLIVAICLVSGAILACGSSLSSGPQDAGGSEAMGHDASTLVEASQPEASPDSPTSHPDGKAESGSSDSAPPEAATCLAESPDSTTGLFVTATGGSTGAACGTLAMPCSTLDAALLAASTNPSILSIYVGPGPYTEGATVALPSGMAILGGWDVFGMTWTHNCQAPVINGPSPVFSAANLTSASTLDTLDVVVTASAAGGGSLYGITSTASMLTLNNVSITVPGGGAGGDGTAGDAGPGGSASGCSPSGSGGVGGKGSEGAPGAPGTFGGSGYVTVNASNGSTGTPGGSGTMGGYGAVDTEYVGCTFVSPTCVGTAEKVEGGTGVSGCGGGGGYGGGAGSGGGCSIALYVWGGTVTLTGGRLEAGSGGPGGEGLAGGGGGSGSAGIKGTPTSYNPSCFTDPVPSPHCAPVTQDTAAGGSAGGPGGTGGAGGQGGGGAGGCSYGYYAGNSATVTATGTAIDTGPPAAGGKPNGPPGTSAKHN